MPEGPSACVGHLLPVVGSALRASRDPFAFRCSFLLKGFSPSWFPRGEKGKSKMKHFKWRCTAEVPIFVENPLSFSPKHSISNSVASVGRNQIKRFGNTTMISKPPVLVLNYFTTRFISGGERLRESLHFLRNHSLRLQRARR